jgi:hypothetical protein
MKAVITSAQFEPELRSLNKDYKQDISPEFFNRTNFDAPRWRRRRQKHFS